MGTQIPVWPLLTVSSHPWVFLAFADILASPFPWLISFGPFFPYYIKSFNFLNATHRNIYSRSSGLRRAPGLNPLKSKFPSLDPKSNPWLRIYDVILTFVVRQRHKKQQSKTAVAVAVGFVAVAHDIFASAPVSSILTFCSAKALP